MTNLGLKAIFLIFKIKKKNIFLNGPAFTPHLNSLAISGKTFLGGFPYTSSKAVSNTLYSQGHIFLNVFVGISI